MDQVKCYLLIECFNKYKMIYHFPFPNNFKHIKHNEDPSKYNNFQPFLRYTMLYLEIHLKFLRIKDMS